MSFVLCCLLGNKKNVDRNIDDNYKKDMIKNTVEQIEGIQTEIFINKNTNERRNSKHDTLIDITQFEKCQYWFTEILKCVVYKYEDYGNNKKELFEYTFKFIDLNKTLKYYRKYNKKYNDYSSQHISEFCKDKSNEDFIQDIQISENVYRYH